VTPKAQADPTSPQTSPPIADTFLARIWQQFRQHWLLVCLLIALMMFAIFAGPSLLFGPKVRLSSVLQRDFVQSVVASGRVETPHRVNIGVQITGTVAEVPVVEGEVVALNTLLIRLRSEELTAAVTQANSAIQLAEAELRHLQDVTAPMAEQALREAEANQNAAFKSLTRYKALFAQDMISRSILDESDRLERGTRSKVSSLQLQFASAKADGSQMALATAALKQAQAGQQLASAKLTYSNIHAPVAGILIARAVEPGDVVQPGRVLMQLSPTAKMQLVVQIDEKNMHLLQLQQQALASADAYPQQTFKAELVYINPGIDAVRGAVEVKLQVLDPPVYLRQDMTVSVDIAVAFRANAVLVPSDVIHDVSSDEPWVLKLVGRKVVRQPLRLGLRSNGWAEVLSGLAVGDKVVPLSEKAILAGSRIRELALGVATP
jgi:HlyD family secretion protein